MVDRFESKGPSRIWGMADMRTGKLENEDPKQYDIQEWRIFKIYGVSENSEAISYV